jgi:hypothetical protein
VVRQSLTGVTDQHQHAHREIDEPTRFHERQGDSGTWLVRIGEQQLLAFQRHDFPWQAAQLGWTNVVQDTVAVTLERARKRVTDRTAMYQPVQVPTGFDQHLPRQTVVIQDALRIACRAVGYFRHIHCSDRFFQPQRVRAVIDEQLNDVASAGEVDADEFRTQRRPPVSP